MLMTAFWTLFSLHFPVLVAAGAPGGGAVQAGRRLTAGGHPAERFAPPVWSGHHQLAGPNRLPASGFNGPVGDGQDGDPARNFGGGPASVRLTDDSPGAPAQDWQFVQRTELHPRAP